MSMRHLLGLALCLILAADRLDAQVCQVAGPSGTCSVTATMSLTVPAIVRLTVSSATTAFVINETSYDLGTATAAGPTITVKSNRPWRVQISTINTFWTAVNTSPGTPARTDKSISELTYSTGGGYTPITNVGTQIAGGTATGNGTVSLTFRSTWSYLLDTPGAYSVPITVTVFSP